MHTGGSSHFSKKEWVIWEWPMCNRAITVSFFSEDKQYINSEMSDVIYFPGTHPTQIATSLKIYLNARGLQDCRLQCTITLHLCLLRSDCIFDSSSVTVSISNQENSNHDPRSNCWKSQIVLCSVGWGWPKKPQVTPGIGGSFRCHLQQLVIPTTNRTHWVAACGQLTPVGDNMPRFCCCTFFTTHN